LAFEVIVIVYFISVQLLDYINSSLPMQYYILRYSPT